jgi:hypothetical protein
VPHHLLYLAIMVISAAALFVALVPAIRAKREEAFKE